MIIFGPIAGSLICLASTVRDDPANPTKIKIQFPRLEVNFVGTGDLFAALSIAWFVKTDGDLKSSLEKVISTMQAILKRTHAEALKRVGDSGRKLSAADLELKIIQSRNDILNPGQEFKAEILN